MPGALEGIRVLEIIRSAPGSFCTMILADLGADVLKVETPPAKLTKGGGSAVSPGAEDAGLAAFNPNNRNKRSIGLDLKAPEGQRILHDLVKVSDVLIEGFRPGVMKRLAADYESLHKVNPRLVYCSLSGFGQDGPYKDYPGHDINYLSLGGTLSFLGQKHEVPMPPLNLIGDYAGATLHGVIGIMAALMARDRTGEGQHVDVSYLDASIALTAAVPGIWNYFMDGLLPTRGETTFAGVFPYYATYETKDGKFVTLGSIESHLWTNFCRAVERPDLEALGFQREHFRTGPDEATTKAVAELRQLFKTRTRDEWFDFLIANDVCVGKVLEWNEVFEDPHVRHRQMLVEIDDAKLGKIKHVGPAIKLSGTPATIRSLGPFLGQHTVETLRALGLGDDRIEQLREQGVVA